MDTSTISPLRSIAKGLVTVTVTGCCCEQDASSVVQALQNIYGINPKRLTAAGRGEFNPVAGNDTAEGKARNRRTEIIITPKLDQFMDLIDQAPDNSSSGIMGDENTKE